VELLHDLKGDHLAPGYAGSEEGDDTEDSDSPRTPRTPRGTPVREGFSFTRKQALRTLPVYLLSVDKFFAAIIGAGCSQVLLQV
jgi:hypothetical protein